MEIDDQGVIQRANRRAMELLRLKPSHLQGAALSSLLRHPPAESLAAWYGRAAEEEPPPLEAMVSTGFPIRVSFRAALPGTGHLFLCLHEGLVAPRAQEKGRPLEAELRSVLDSIEVGVLLLDEAGRIRFANARLGQWFGLDAPTLEKVENFEELDQLISERFRKPETFRLPWRSFARGDGEPVRDELEIARPTRRVLERFSRPVLDREGRRAGWLEIYTDITGERQIQSKMLQTEKMAALGQLVSGIAHELNNPLTAIMGYTQLLLGHGLQPGQFEEAKKVFQEAERARRIVKNLLYFARETRPERTRVQLNEIVERTLALRSYELKVENIVVECQLAPDLPETMADPYQLQQVVLNLLVNAEQALLEARGHGHVWIRTHSLPDNRISLEVSDDGPGVSPEIVSRVFDPFFTTKPSGIGTGLGLSIVYGIVQQHDGEVLLENVSGGGAKFIVELPVLAVPKGAPPTEAAEVAAPARQSITGRILVVEDEPSVAQLVRDVLGEEGHDVEAVLESQEGLTRLSRERYDLVICDLRMPRLDGPAFYEALVRAGSPMRHRIIFITGDTLAPKTLDFLNRHGLPYLAKPFLVEELKLAVNRLLSPQRDETGKTEPSSDSETQPARPKV